jgi:NTE family protein
MNFICSFDRTSRHSYYLGLTIMLVFIVVILCPLIVIAQSEPPTPKRLTIGVALEGGGALGLAHIGVLRWFEQHHIPIDYLSGNSMGALVGGMYATGKSPDELEQLVKGMDWPLVIGGKTPFEDLSFHRKEDVRATQNDLAIVSNTGRHSPLPRGILTQTIHSAALSREWPLRRHIL